MIGQTDAFNSCLQDSHTLSELNGGHPAQQYTPNSSTSSTSTSGGTAENPVDLSNSRPPPTHDQRNGGLLHDSSKFYFLKDSLKFEKRRKLLFKRLNTH